MLIDTFFNVILQKKVYLLLKNQFKNLKDATFYVGHFRVYTDG